MNKALLIVGILGAVLSLCVVGVSFGLHLMNPRNISLEEAMMGVVPGGLCCSLFFVLAVVGLILVLVTPKRDAMDDQSDEDE